ncbi:MAG: 16S rRNA (guanine(966)-N(2))-methyltransferase RsmD [Neisseria sp.]|jgi:16S rRNA (guanine966-N2)-methyltransferase
MKKSQHSNQVRIIGGQNRGRKLIFSDADGLRPTPDSVRERLFNWLGQDLAGMEVLDLFSGSGALGFEAHSRHAKHVIMIDNNQQTVQNLQQNARVLGAQVEIIQKDSLAYLTSCSSQYDLVLLDPPFAWDEWSVLFSQLEQHLKANAKVYIEAGCLPSFPAYLSPYKQGKTGQSLYVLLENKIAVTE